MKRIVMMLFAGLLAVPSVSYAEWLQGTITKIDINGGNLTLENLDTKKPYPQPLNLKVTQDAELKNIASLQDLKNGQAVKVDVKENTNLGVWEAKSVEYVGASPS